MDYKRTETQTKKEYYRRIAQIKKNNWINEHKSWEGSSLKSHFIYCENINQDQNKTKKTSKGQQKTVQKLKNRIAAQASRQKHVSYVKELEQKVQKFEKMFIKQGALCKDCKKNLLSQINVQCQTIISQQFSDHISSLNPFNYNQSQDQIISSYLNDQIVRIDNKDANTPFAIFFIFCVLGVLALCGLSSSTPEITPRLLASYETTVNQLMLLQDNIFEHNYLTEQNQKKIQLQTMQNTESLSGFKEQNLIEQFMPANVDVSLNISKNWTKHGDYICSYPSFIVKQQSVKINRGPQFLLLKTGKNRSKSLSKLNVTIDQKLGHRINIQSNQWQNIQISQCFRQNL